jgi:hypothetical protein
MGSGINSKFEYGIIKHNYTEPHGLNYGARRMAITRNCYIPTDVRKKDDAKNIIPSITLQIHTKGR